MSVNILLLGANGQVGWELRRALLPLGKVLPLGRAEVDFTHLDGLRTVLDSRQPRIIVNAAAYTAVDKAESESELAWRVNADAPALLAEWALENDAWLVHYSTDYVFDGTLDRPYTELDTPNPQSVYGKSKFAGEQAISASGCRHLILRTSWVYAARGANFAKTMLRLACERNSLRVVADQIGSPTSAELIADLTALILHRVLTDPSALSLDGLYHLTAAGHTSWHGYARHVLTQAKKLGWPLRCPPDAVQPIKTEDYPLPAKRPANSRLDTSKLRAAFDLTLPDWTVQVDRMLDELPK
jgi:dTDP-4-dehydrorhamnose reductase